MRSRIRSRRFAVVVPLAWAFAALGCAHSRQGPEERLAQERAATDSPRTLTVPEVFSRMSGLGFEPTREKEAVALRPGARVTLDRSIPAGDCAVFGATAPEAGDALILRMRRGDELLAADTAGRPAAFVAHCAEEDIEIHLELEIAVNPSPALPRGGRGITLLSFSAPRSTVPAWAGPPLWAAAPPRTLAAAESALSRRIESAGYDRRRTLLEVSAAQTGDRHRFSIDLASGQCGILVAAAGPGVGGLVVETRSDADNPADRAVGDERLPALLSLCRAEEGPVTVELAVIAGSGQVRATFHPLPDVPLPLSLADPPLALREAAAIFARHGMTAADVLPSPSPFPGGVWSARFEARAGFCYGMAAAGRDGVPLGAFRAVDVSGNELGRWTGPAAPALLAHCVHGAPQEIVLEILESLAAGDADKEKPVIAVFALDVSILSPFMGR